MWNFSAGIIVCFASLTVIYSESVRHPQRNPTTLKKVDSLVSRYALPTNVHAVTAKLPYTFGYRFTDDYGTIQSREEKTNPNGSKTGSYSFVDPKGIYRRVDYIADRHGFRATVMTNEPGTLSADPAHVQIRNENDKSPSIASYRQAAGNSPHRDFSSNVFSQFGSDPIHSKSNLIATLPSLGYVRHNSIFGKSAIFESERIVPEQEVKFQDNINTYKGSPFPSIPPASPITLQQLDGPNSVGYVKAQRQNTDSFFNGPSFNPKYIFDENLSDVEYQVTPPTRYPRILRDSRSRSKRKRPVLKVHIPQGYENLPNLPLYRDK